MLEPHCCGETMSEGLAMDKPKAASTSAVRMAGYLEKRGKMKVVSTWKKYWFVLEGQLLLYYKSQLEYINLSACRGSLNIGLASCVRPGHGGQSLTIQVITRTQCVTLRSKERYLQEQWLQALLDSMALPNTTCSLKRQQMQAPQHFRYSLDNLPSVQEADECVSEDSCDKKSTMPRSVSRRDSMLQRIRRMGGISYANNRPDGGTRHKELGKSLSTSVIETLSSGPPTLEEEEPEDSSEKFQNNLKTVRDLLQMSKPDDVKEHYSSLDEVNADVKNPDVQDENQNTADKRCSEDIIENNYLYQSTEVPDPKEEDEEEYYYCSYDEVKLMNDLIHKKDEEPVLPPSPSEKIEYEILDTVQCSEKKKKKHTFRDNILFRDFRTKMKKTDKDGDAVKKKKKREPSFLKKLVTRRAKKKPVVENDIDEGIDERVDEPASDEEPEYECVSYQMQAEQPRAAMTSRTILELKDKFEARSNQDTNSDEGSEDYETIYSTGSEGHATSRRPESDSDQAAGWTPRSSHVSAEHLYAESSKSIPSLPPRREKRPPSPWHDVPTNNGPCDFQTAPDEILNTPQGFRFIQDQWKTREWNREQQQVTFPNKSTSRTSINEAPVDSAKNNKVELHNEMSRNTAQYSDDDQPDSLEKETMRPDDAIASPVQLRSQSKESVALSTDEIDEDQQIIGINRYSDELHLLLAQLAEITSAPLFQIGATKSLMAATTLTLDEELGPIRRRRHSDPDYDVPRPHGSLQLLVRDTLDTSMSPDSLEPC